MSGVCERRSGPRRRRRTHQRVVEAVELLYANDLRRFARVLCWHHFAVGNARDVERDLADVRATRRSLDEPDRGSTMA